METWFLRADIFAPHVPADLYAQSLHAKIGTTNKGGYAKRGVCPHLWEVLGGSIVL